MGLRDVLRNIQSDTENYNVLESITLLNNHVDSKDNPHIGFFDVAGTSAG